MTADVDPSQKNHECHALPPLALSNPVKRPPPPLCVVPGSKTSDDSEERGVAEGGLER